MNKMSLRLYQIIAFAKSIVLIGPSATWHLWKVTRQAKKSGVNMWLSDVRGE